MSEPSSVLIVADHALSDEAVAGISGRYAGRRIVILMAGTEGEPLSYPPEWQPLAPGELIDPAALRQDFLTFLDRWPNQPLKDGATFDQLFRTRDGYSLWWTGPGAERHPLRGPFPALRVLWLSARAIVRVRPQEVMIATRNARLAHCLSSQCEAARIMSHAAPGCANPDGSAWRGRLRWLGGSVAWLARFVPLALVRALAFRLLGGKSARPVEAPAIVLTALFPQHVHRRDSSLARSASEGAASVWYWEPVVRALVESANGVTVRHLLRLDGEELRRRGGWLKALCGLRRVPDLLPPAAQLGPRSLIGNAVRQLRLLLRYSRVEALPAFRQSFRFCGADVSALYVPCLRQAVRQAVRWEAGVDAAAASLRAAGDVRVAVVHEEFYAQAGMILIAACRRLGIPTVGAQHGTIYPTHLVYTLPPGQVAGAPTPDYFAAYGEFAGEVVSVHGAYPAGRVRVCGGPRFDALAAAPPDRAACRRRLGLPPDRFVLLVATQGPAWFPTAVRALLDAVRKAPDLCLCIKCWNGDAHRDLYHRLAAEARPADVRVFADRFDDLLGACDALASVSSTTVLEATLLGKPTLCLNLSGEPDRYPYAEEGVSLAARTPEEIRQAAHTLRSFAPTAAWHERRRRFLIRHLGPTADGGGAAVFARFLRQFLPSPGRASRAA